MSKTKIASGAALGLVVLSSFWFSEQESPDTDHQTAQASPVPSIEETVQEAGSSALTQPAHSSSRAKGAIEESEAVELSMQINQAIQSYEEISQYPPYSQPIKNKEHLNSFVNSVKPESSLPFPFEGIDQPIGASIVLDQYNYFFGDVLSAEVALTNLPMDAVVDARTQLMTLSGEVLASMDAEIVTDGATHKAFETKVDTKDYETGEWPLEMNMAVLAEVDGNHLFLTAPFRINRETAKLESIGFSEVQSEHLNIPLNISVTLPGYYFVSAVLYSGESELPLVYLETEGPLDSGSGNLALKAHIQALKQSGDEGPYELRNIRIERWSDEVIQMDVAGKVAEGEFIVEGYRFQDFEDRPYQDPLKEERVRIMQGLSSL